MLKESHARAGRPRAERAVAAVLTVGIGLLGAAVSCSEPAPEVTGNPTTWKILSWAAASASASIGPPGKPPPVVEKDEGTPPKTLDEQRAVLFRRMKKYFDYPDEMMAAVRKLFENSPIMGQGNPKVTEHPMSRAECFAIREKANLAHLDHPVCGVRNMVPLYKVKEGEKEEDARVCIDQYEFPNMPCEYPVVHASAREAALLCEALGKRLCDAHEWEGACAGYLRDPKDEYAFGRTRKDMKAIHNHSRDVLWAYGKEKNHALCGTGSRKSEDCTGGGYLKCGSNTYPAGAFPKCVSTLHVYDQHGNAAEHMNYALKPEQLASRGGSGETEMKGSWFIFQRYEAHDDDCHWRAPDWHATKVMSPNSHSNYHLGFRCCLDVKKVEPKKD
ncbi:MAG: SUMF1/EgtB/PvdO family nonheme iron enzyme [Myxococcota bacterium]